MKNNSFIQDWKEFSLFEKIFFSVSTLLALILYLIPINNEILMLDYQALVVSLKKINSFEQYLNSIGTEKILDIQPVRDLSHFIDIKINDILGMTNFGLIHNIILLFITSYLLFKIFKHYRINTRVYLVSTFLLHPAIFHVFIEETSRKHILSLLFSLLTFYLFLKTDFKKFKSKLLGCFTFLLACFSHPISIYLPVSLLISPRNNESLRSRLKNICPLFLISFSVGVISLIYYKNYYPSITQVNKILYSFNFGETLLNIGRYPLQFFFPFNFSIFYDTPGLKEYLGLLLLIILIAICFKRFKTLTFFIWSFFFACMIILYHGGVDINYLNTYILVPTLSFLFYIAFLFQKMSSKKVLIIFSLIALIITPFSFYYSFIRTDGIRFVKNNYLNQPNCRNLHYLVLELATYGPREDMLLYGKKQLQENCMVRNVFHAFNPIFLLTVLVYVDPEMTLDKKLELIKEKLVNKYDIDLINEALIAYNNTNYHLQTNFDQYNEPSTFLKSIVGIELSQFCENKKDKNCISFLNYKERVKDKEARLRVYLNQALSL